MLRVHFWAFADQRWPVHDSKNTPWPLSSVSCASNELPSFLKIFVCFLAVILHVLTKIARCAGSGRGNTLCNLQAQPHTTEEGQHSASCTSAAFSPLKLTNTCCSKHNFSLRQCLSSGNNCSCCPAPTCQTTELLALLETHLP